MNIDLEVAEVDVIRARHRMRIIRAGGYAVSASYLHRVRSVRVLLNNGLCLSFSTRTVPGLVCAKARDLSQIEVSASGLGLHWPALDVDVYVPELLNRHLGTRPRQGCGNGLLAIHRSNERMEHEVFNRLKAQLAQAYSVPEAVCESLTATDVIARGRS